MKSSQDRSMVGRRNSSAALEYKGYPRTRKGDWRRPLRQLEYQPLNGLRFRHIEVVSCHSEPQLSRIGQIHFEPEVPCSLRRVPSSLYQPFDRFWSEVVEVFRIPVCPCIARGKVNEVAIFPRSRQRRARCCIRRYGGAHWVSVLVQRYPVAWGFQGKGPGHERAAAVDYKHHVVGPHSFKAQPTSTCC